MSSTWMNDLRGRWATLDGNWESKRYHLCEVWSVERKKLIPRFGKRGAVVDPMVPPQRYAHVLTPGTCECDIIWKKGLCRWNVKMRSSWIIQWALNPISSALTRDMERRHGDRNSMWRRRIRFGLCSQHATPGTTKEMAKGGFSPSPSGGAWLCQNLGFRACPQLNFVLLASWTVRTHLCCF